MHLSVISSAFMLAQVAAGSFHRDAIDLPTGWLPEGIALGRDHTVYVGSFNGGSVWEGDLETGVGRVVVEEEGQTAMGMTFDKRNDYLWVCGGFAGSVKVYDTLADFHLVAEVQLAAEGDLTFVNDVILTKTYAYITESSQLQFYKIPLDRKSGGLADGDATMAETVPLSSNFSFTPGTILEDGALNSNGLVMSDDEKALIIVNELSGELYRVDPESGEATVIDLGGVFLRGGDGLVLRENTLWVCQNRFLGDPDQQINEVLLSEDLSCGTVTRKLQNEFFNDPATAILRNNQLWATMSKFLTPVEDWDTTEYQIVRADRDSAVAACSLE